MQKHTFNVSAHIPYDFCVLVLFVYFCDFCAIASATVWINDVFFWTIYSRAELLYLQIPSDTYLLLFCFFCLFIGFYEFKKSSLASFLLFLRMYSIFWTYVIYGISGVQY